MKKLTLPGGTHLFRILPAFFMSMTEGEIIGGKPWTRARERWLLLLLAAIQFTTVVDFLIIMPLGPQYMAGFHIGPREFGLIVSAYGLSAGVAGLMGAFVLDRFDRRRALTFLYAGFAVGTLSCGLARTYPLLVCARALAGAFGGLGGAVLLAIVGDAVPMERRGAAMGLVMSSFSVASIVGVPVGLYVANRWSWHLPFLALAAISLAILLTAISIAPPMRKHLEHYQEEHPVARTWAVMVHPDHQKAYLLMAGITIAGFCIFPFLSSYMVANVGLTNEQVPWIYLCGGSATLFSMNLIGRWSDRSGKRRVFTIMSLTTAVPILIISNLSRVPLAYAIAASTLLMVCMSGRMVPAMALMTGAVEARYRGGFMSVNSSVQQFSMGLASLGAGLILGVNERGELTRFNYNGFISILCAYVSIYLARFLRLPKPQGQASEGGQVVETVVAEGV